MINKPIDGIEYCEAPRIKNKFDVKRALKKCHERPTIGLFFKCFISQAQEYFNVQRDIIRQRHNATKLYNISVLESSLKPFKDIRDAEIYLINKRYSDSTKDIQDRYDWAMHLDHRESEKAISFLDSCEIKLISTVKKLIKHASKKSMDEISDELCSLEKLSCDIECAESNPVDEKVKP